MYELLEQVLRKLTRATTQYFSDYDSDNPLLRSVLRGTSL